MIFLGAGASVPLGIPAMKGFVQAFEIEVKKNEELEPLYKNIETSIEESEELIDTRVTFDLESLMAVLEDISGVIEKRTVSLPTLAFVLHQFRNGKLEEPTINAARQFFGGNAKKMLRRLRLTIFNVCMNPIAKGERDGHYAGFVKYFEPIFTLLGIGSISSAQNRWIFTTNWDLCSKTWLDYINETFDDGSIQDPQNRLVLDPLRGWSSPGAPKETFRIVPLHGSLDLVRTKRLMVGGHYEDIVKLPGPHTHAYFKGKPGNMEKIFIIYPLEAVGYEHSVRSPYREMLNHLQEILMNDYLIFVIGFSFRDPTIASIFEEVLRERVRRKDWHPLGSSWEERAERAKDMHFKLFLLDSNPDGVMSNLEKQGFVNIQNACIPIEVKFPDVYSNSFREQFSDVLIKVGNKLVEAGIIRPHDLEAISRSLNEDYQLNMPTVEEV